MPLKTDCYRGRFCFILPGMVRVPRSRWSVLVVMVALSALCVTPLACVLNCLLGVCMHAAQAQPTTAAHTALPVGGAVATTTPATPNTLTPAPATPKHHCCTVKKQERPSQPAAEALATPATLTSVAPAAKPASGEPVLRFETSRLTAGSQDLRETSALVGTDGERCGCTHTETSDRFTVAPVFAVEAPLASPVHAPVRLSVARLFTAPQPPVAVAYQPSRRETYLRCCVFRI